MIQFQQAAAAIGNHHAAAQAAAVGKVSTQFPVPGALAGLSQLGKAITWQVHQARNHFAFFNYAEEIEQLGAPWHFAGIGQLALFAQCVDGGGFSGVGAAGKNDFWYAGAWTFVHAGCGNLEMCVVEIDCHACILDASVWFEGL